ncbi:MAG: thiamine-phosphate kinase [Deltaproteobacteria bacterium]
MGEFELIEKLKKILPRPSKKVWVGIGDDTLVAVPPKERLLWTVDCLVENIHFDFAYMNPEDVGWKSLAVNLSDIAAMGGKSLYALVSLGIPSRVPEKKILKIYQGIRECAEWAKVDVVGGNISRTTHDFFIDITVVGETAKPILRRGAKPGECVAVTGFPGLSASGLQAFKKWGRKAIQKFPVSTQHHARPKPRLEWAQTLGTMGVSSLIDISDGLSSELNHLSENSRIGIEIEEKLLPIHPEVTSLADPLKLNPLEVVLNGGEEYELLMTFPYSKFGVISAKAQAHSIPLTMIGYTVESHRNVSLRTRSGKLKSLKAKGWTHF